MNEHDYRDSKIAQLEAEKSRLTGLLIVAGIALFILGSLFANANKQAGLQSEMVDSCIGEIADLNSTIGSTNDALDSISSDAANAAGEDYDTQYDTLSDISSAASDAQGSSTEDSTACEQPAVASDTSD